MLTVDPSTFDSSSLFRFAVKPNSISVTLLPTETVTLVTTLTVAAGLDVMDTGCNDAFVVLRTESSAVTNDVMSVDVVMKVTATLTSVVVITAETSVNNRLEPFVSTTETALLATPFASAIARLAASVLIPSGKA
jgi:hypothetical protein